MFTFLSNTITFLLYLIGISILIGIFLLIINAIICVIKQVLDNLF